jgi:endonuclease/exonuclease/phosphatase family metal-dependent hydrolase
VVKIIVKLLATLVGLVLVAVLVFLGVATATEYRPRAKEALPITAAASKATIHDIKEGDSLTLVSFNIGYAGLGKDQDFFMDGGKMVRPSSEQIVRDNLKGIEQTLQSNPADVYFMQEVDEDSKRSYNINEQRSLLESTGLNGAFAYNFKSMYTPYPWPPIGKVSSGLLTLTNLDAADAERISLPVPFSWPVRLFNLKRCLLVERVSLGKDTKAELVLINLHLEAYSDPDARDSQTKVLLSLMKNEYAKGNYVIAGGDFNQDFPDTDFPEVADNWRPSVLDVDSIPDGWQVASDAKAPTSRLNNKPYSGNAADTQLFGIDGFIVTPNVTVDEVETLDEQFAYSDHNPVRLRVTLAPPSKDDGGGVG